MPTMKWDNLVAQDRVKELLGHAFESGTLGHAYLFCGERGVGKFAAAVDLAMAVLCKCKDINRARPCGECSSCKKVMSYSHPDLHVIMPLCLGAEHKGGEGGALSEEGWALASDSVRARIDDPYRLPQYDGIPHIPVDWVREADHAVMRGPVEGASGVAVIDGVDTMKKESANAMLKTLEEPPPGTLMLLLTDRVHGVLPTILSRCQTVRFPLLPPEAVGAELCRRFNIGGGSGGVDKSDSAAAAASAGSLGLAISEYENPLHEYYGYAASLWEGCLRGDWGAAAAEADSLSASKDSYNVCRNTLSCLIRLLREAFLKKFGRCGASMNYINHGSSGDLDVSAICAPDELSAVVRLAQGSLSGLDARGNATLVMAGLVCSLMEALNVEKQ
jgi:DNA polymerase III delta' subunit